MNALPARVLIAGTVVIVVTIAAAVVLTLEGFDTAAAGLPILVGSIVPLYIGQSKIASSVEDAHATAQTALNGGLSATVEGAVTKVLTKMAAVDEATGTATVATAATRLTGEAQPVPPPPPSTFRDAIGGPGGDSGTGSAPAV